MEGAVQGYPLEIRHRDGNVTPVLYNASIYRNAIWQRPRRVRRRAGYQRAETGPCRAPAKRGAAPDDPSDGDGRVLGHRPQGKLLEVNDAVCRNLGYSREELLRMSVSDIEVVEKPEEILQSVQRIMEKGSDKIEGKHR